MKPQDTSKALERTLLNWQRTTLSMFALSALSIKLALPSQRQILLITITLIALAASTILILFRFFTRPKYAQYVPVMLLMSAIVIVLIGLVCTASLIAQ